MSEHLDVTLAKVAKNYQRMFRALQSVRGSLVSIEARTCAMDPDPGDEGTAAIARSGLRTIDDTISTLEVI